MKFKPCRLCCVKNMSFILQKENKRKRYQCKFFRGKNINFIVDEYDGEVLDKAKTSKRMC